MLEAAVVVDRWGESDGSFALMSWKRDGVVRRDKYQ